MCDAITKTGWALFVVITRDVFYPGAIKQNHPAYLWMHLHLNTGTFSNDAKLISSLQIFLYTET